MLVIIYIPELGVIRSWPPRSKRYPRPHSTYYKNKKQNSVTKASHLFYGFLLQKRMYQDSLISEPPVSGAPKSYKSTTVCHR